jgi:hypothetical protein
VPPTVKEMLTGTSAMWDPEDQTTVELLKSGALIVAAVTKVETLDDDDIDEPEQKKPEAKSNVMSDEEVDLRTRYEVAFGKKAAVNMKLENLQSKVPEKEEANRVAAAAAAAGNGLV